MVLDVVIVDVERAQLFPTERSRVPDIHGELTADLPRYGQSDVLGVWRQQFWIVHLWGEGATIHVDRCAGCQLVRCHRNERRDIPQTNRTRGQDTLID